MDDHIVKYNTNYKRFLFKTLSKLEIINPIIKPIKKNTMDWEVAVAIFQ